MRPLTKITGNFYGGPGAENWARFPFQESSPWRAYGVQQAIDSERPVQREINDGVRKRHALAGEGVPGEGGGGNNQRRGRDRFFQFAGQSDAGENFSHGNSVQENRASAPEAAISARRARVG